MATVAGFLTLAYGLKHQSGWVFLIVWQFVQFGTSSAYVILYVSNASVFPTLFQATSFGFLNFASMFSTALAPQISNVEEPTPVITFTIAALVSAICTIFIKTQPSDLLESKLTNQALYKRVSTVGGGSSVGAENRNYESYRSVKSEMLDSNKKPTEDFVPFYPANTPSPLK